MAATLFISVLLTILITWVVYDYSRFKGHLALYQKKIHDYEKTILQLHENEHNLKLLSTDLQDRLEQAGSDPITNLLSWHLFEDRLNQSLKESVRYNFNLAVMFIDVTEFKVINSALGYEIGDALLQQIAERLQKCIRQVDSITRFSKDIFAVMLPQLGKPETAAIVAQRMLQVIAAPFHVGQHELYVSTAIGIAIFPTDSNDLTNLLRGAEYALRIAKEKGKQSYQFYQERMNIDSKRELAISNGLRRDNFPHELVSYYQPIMNVSKKTIFCMDAIICWQNAELGLVDSNELYSYATKQNKLDYLTEWLLRNACKQYLYWRTIEFTPELVGLPVHIRQLENTNFLYRLSQILQELNFKPEWIMLEITAGFTQFSTEALEKAFNMLNYMGIKLCINDFGTGLFSLKELKDYRVHYLKFDPAFIKDIQSPQNVTLLKHLIQMASALSIIPIANGIESKEQVSSLKTLGCDLMQGTYIAAPLPEKDVSGKIALTPAD